MRAIIYDPAAACGLRLAEVSEPRPAKNQALIQVQAVSINFADVAFLAQRFKPGEAVGFEAAGVVLEAARDAAGPPTGSRVAGFAGKGAWAERCAIDAGQLALVPDGVELVAAAAIPVAGVTALRAVRALGPILGERVLITGASGGVGRMAVQLAAAAGAHVIACIGSPERGAGLDELGAAEIVVSLKDVAPVHSVLENVGGEQLAQAYALLKPGGALKSIGTASLKDSCLDFEQARLRGGGQIEAFNVFTHGGAFGEDLAMLLDRTARGGLRPEISWRGSWTLFEEAVAAFRGRRVRGKAVLELTD